MFNLPIELRTDGHGIPYLVYELTIPVNTNAELSGTDCPAEKCSACGELFEEGADFCSHCGRMVIRNA